MNPDDPRVHRTFALLGDALVMLSEEKGYENVTIRDITERAGVAYVTFFRHFESKNALFMHMFTKVMAEISAAVSAAQDSMLDEEASVLWFRHIDENRAFLRTALQARTVRRAWHDGFAHAFQTSLERQTALRPESDVPSTVAADLMAASLLRLMESSVESESPRSPEVLAQWFQQLVVQPVLMLDEAAAGSVSA